MESLLLAASVVIPLLIYMAVGIFIRKSGILTIQNFKAMNTLVFRIFLPLTLFFDILSADLQKTIQPKAYVFAVIGILVSFAAAWTFFTRTIKENSDASSMIQAVYRSNFVLFGSLISAGVCGPAGVALIAGLAAVVVPLFNILAVILFELKRGGDIRPLQLIKNIFKNPLVDAGLLGGLCSLLHVQIPELIKAPLMTLGDIATPLALVTLGGLLSFASIKNHRKYLIMATIGRLIVIPSIALGLAVALGFRGDILVGFIAVFASPTAVSSTPMAQVMGGNATLAAEIVAATSVCCVITIFLWIYGFSTLGLI